jgi:hypothetical protein
MKWDPIATWESLQDPIIWTYHDRLVSDFKPLRLSVSVNNQFVSFKGGVHLTKEPKKVPELVNAMIGHRLITKQTPKDGIPVSKVLFQYLAPLSLSYLSFA